VCLSPLPPGDCGQGVRRRGTRVAGGDLVARRPPALRPGGGGWAPAAAAAAPIFRPGSSGRSALPIGFSRGGAARQTRRHVAVVPHCTNW